MTVQFAPNVVGNDRGEIQLFLEHNVDRDTDVHLATRSEIPGNYVCVTAGWHVGDDPQGLHLTVRVFFNNVHVQTAHVYPNGQVTAM